MTIAFTAIPVKMTKSTIRFFLGGCMGNLIDFKDIELAPVYSNVAGRSIIIGQTAILFEVD